MAEYTGGAIQIIDLMEPGKTGGESKGPIIRGPDVCPCDSCICKTACSGKDSPGAAAQEDQAMACAAYLRFTGIEYLPNQGGGLVGYRNSFISLSRLPSRTVFERVFC